GEWKLLEETNLGQFEFKTVSVNELRTAIAEHDSRVFKVGDLVVYLSSIAPEHNDIYEVWKVDLTGCLIVLNDMDYRAIYHQIRHATPEEIIAGHRLEAERHG
ncbi:hypothetical protein ACG9ZL_19955, partial [Acinetobacter sp. ULE_I057]|uniref:hypothetical protein n=1 Tax=Acinetobacter sp. ULE_I057 TaxID=3373070 RepID=UPI003AF42D3C